MKFSELSAQSKARAIDINRYVLIVDDVYCEDALGRFEQDLEDIGFSDVNISYYGFGGEGDGFGVNFTSSEIDIEKFLRSQDCFFDFSLYVPKYGKNKIDYSLSISRHDDDEFHEANLYIEKHIAFVAEDAHRNKIHQISDAVMAFASKKRSEIYLALLALYQEHIKDDMIAAHLNASGWEFNAIGELI